MLSLKFSFYSQLLLLSCVLLRVTDGAVQGPVADNRLFCEQCFCFICDKLASAVRLRPVKVSDSLTHNWNLIHLQLTTMLIKSGDI